MPNVRAKRAFTVALVRIARAFGNRRPRRKRLPVQLYPSAIERGYMREMFKLVDVALDALAPLRQELPSLLASATRERMDAGEGKRTRTLIEQAQKRMEQTIRQEDLERMAKMVAERTSTHQKAQLQKQVRAAFGADVLGTEPNIAGLIDGFVEENVVLIKSIPRSVVEKTEQAVTRALANATPHPTLAKELVEVAGFGKRRAKLIARDQVGKLLGQVNSARQKSMGVTAFVWRTVNDERVRKAHRELDGRTFLYSDPPSEGLPGQPINCRCTADPVMDDLLAELDRL